MNWSLVVATYNRPESLRRCLNFAIAQSRPPAEIVVVDASDAWEEHKTIVLQDLVPRAFTNVLWRYDQACVRSSASQRNQGIALATGDVLFLIDDDSFMHPGCADEVMKIYEADIHHRVSGVAPVETYESPEESDQLVSSSGTFNRAAKRPLNPRSFVRLLSRFIEQEYRSENFCLPYDGVFPDHPLPQELTNAAAMPTRYFNGFQMTFRASVIRKIGFDETLKRYAAAEDLDASYRASRCGLLLHAINAHIYHARDPQQRLSRYTRELFGLMNLAYLYRRNGRDSGRLLGAYRSRLLRRLVFDIGRDVGRKRFSLPCVRADVETLLRLHQFKSVPLEGIADWYIALQDQLCKQG